MLVADVRVHHLNHQAAITLDQKHKINNVVRYYEKLYGACDVGILQEVKRLLTAGADVNTQRLSARVRCL